MKSVLFAKKSKPDPELLALKAELQTAQADLALAYRQFDQALDPELVESCVYQISAVKARCNYLIRSIKERSPEALAAFRQIPATDRRGARGGAAKALPQSGDDGGDAAWT
nr:DUF2508 family protein [uncultured Oscillibacter sp.]